MGKWLDVIKRTAAEWQEDDAPALAASLSYYTLLSVAPLSLLCVAIVGFVFGEEAARGQVAEQISAVTGPEAADAIQDVVRNADQSGSNVLSTIVGIVTALVGASGVFGQLQSALNTMWDVKPKPDRGWKGLVRDRFLSFTMVLAVAFILLASLAVTALLSSVGKFLSDGLPGGAGLWQVINSALSLGVITALFMLIFKVVPDAQMRWRDAAVGGAVTAVLFTVGKYLLGLYLGRSSVGSAFGAAGSVIAFVVWVYYVSQILFMGAEFTQVYARMMGKPIAPDKHSVAADNKVTAETERPPEPDPSPASARSAEPQGEPRMHHLTTKHPGTASAAARTPELLHSIIDDLRVLARDEIALAKLEAREAGQRSATALVALVLGAVLGLISLGLLCVTAVIALQPVIEPLWARMLIMSGVYVAAGAGLVVFCVNRYQKAPMSLPETRQEAARTVRTLKEQVHGG